MKTPKIGETVLVPMKAGCIATVSVPKEQLDSVPKEIAVSVEIEKPVTGKPN